MSEPSKEMIALAERIAGEVHPSITLRRQRATKYAVLRAIMEVTAAAADALENAWNESELAERVRNGEHLR